MAIVFAVRSTSFDARYSNGGKTPNNYNALLEDDAAFIGGKKFNLDRGGVGARFLSYPGGLNLPAGKACSILLRFSVPYTGTPANLLGLWGFGRWLAGAGYWGTFGAQISNASGNLQVYQTNETGTAGLNNAAIATDYSYPAANTLMDWLWKFTGDTTADGCKLYINGTLMGSATSTQTWPDVRNRLLANAITIGQSVAGNSTRISVNEFVIWDEIVDPTSVLLTSGTGSLNGASRSAFVDVAALDGLAWTALAAKNIRAGVSQTQAGVAVNGTLTGSVIVT